MASSALPFVLAPEGSLARSVELLSAFLVEQTDPAHFYGLLAADSVREVSRYAPLAGALVLDVGGGPGYFADAFTAAGARYGALDADAGELTAAGLPSTNVFMGSALALPVADDSVDICYSSNVLEHVPSPQAMAEEMVRVTKPGGVTIISWTLWYSPWGGHETSPWHYLGGRRAADWYAQRHGKRPKNDFGRTMYAAHAGPMLRWADRQRAATLITAYPRYHPTWARWLVRVPVLRECLVWNLVLVLRKHDRE